MLFITSLFFAALAAAVPQPPTLIPREVMTSMTVGEANDLCAAQQVHCCRDEAASENENHSNGLLAGVATGVLGGNGVSVLGVCSPLDVVVSKFRSLLPRFHHRRLTQSSPSQQSAAQPLHWQDCLLPKGHQRPGNYIPPKHPRQEDIG